MKQKFFILLSCLYSVVACNDKMSGIEVLTPSTESKIVVSEEEYYSLIYDDVTSLDDDDIMRIASDFIQSYNEHSNQYNSTKSSPINNYLYEISNIEYCTLPVMKSDNSESLRMPIYEVNYTNNANDYGVIFIAANSMNSEVIAFLPNEIIDKDAYEKSGASFLIEWAKMSAYKRLSDIYTSCIRLREATIKKIADNLNIKQDELQLSSILDKIEVINTKVAPIQSPTTQIITLQEPLVTTQWSQNSPYNSYLPAPNPPSTMSNVYCGCAVTAACQLLTAIKPNLTIDGVTINWDYITENPKISLSDPSDKINMVCKLHEWVFDELNATPQYDENGYHDGTGVSANSQVNFYSTYCNHSEQYSEYDPDAVLRSLRAKRPSLIRGQGHAWILDGYIIAEKSVSTSDMNRAVIVQYYDMFWHANLGWSGSGNGYYKLNADTSVTFNAGGYTFNTDALWVFPGLYATNTSYIF